MSSSMNIVSAFREMSIKVFTIFWSDGHFSAMDQNHLSNFGSEHFCSFDLKVLLFSALVAILCNTGNMNKYYGIFLSH